MRYKQFEADTSEALVGHVQDHLNEINESPVPLHRQFLLTKADNIDDTAGWGIHELPVRVAVRDNLVAQVYDIQIRVKDPKAEEEQKFSKIGQAALLADRDGGTPVYLSYVASSADT